MNKSTFFTGHKWLRIKNEELKIKSWERYLVQKSPLSLMTQEELGMKNEELKIRSESNQKDPMMQR